MHPSFLRFLVLGLIAAPAATKAVVLEQGDIIVVQRANNEVLFAVDGTTGDREVISSCDLAVGTGPCFSNVSGGEIDVALGPDGNIYLVASVISAGPPGVMRIDPATGDREIVSQEGVAGSGVAFDANVAGITVVPAPDLSQVTLLPSWASIVLVAVLIGLALRTVRAREIPAPTGDGI